MIDVNQLGTYMFVGVMNSPSLLGLTGLSNWKLNNQDKDKEVDW